MGSSRFMKGIWCFIGVYGEGFLGKMRGFDQGQIKGSQGLCREGCCRFHEACDNGFNGKGSMGLLRKV